MSQRNPDTEPQPRTGACAGASTDRHGERGYVLPMTALLLIPMMIFAALATDVGSWYVRADQTQRAADAAALAGTVWLPDMAKATAVARDVAARNGFRDPAWVASNGGTANASVTVPGLTKTGGLTVDITTTAPSYFGALVVKNITIQRRAIAAVTRPVRLGNPTNGLGTGNLSSSELGMTPDGVWLSVNGWCQDHQQGDPISVGYYGAAQAGGNYSDTCNSARMGSNPTLNTRGFTFVVDVPAGAGQVNLEMLEPGMCSDSNTSDQLYSTEDSAYSNGPRLNVRVYANDSTLLDDADNLARPAVYTHKFSNTDCTGGVASPGGGRWYPIYNIPSGTANEGRWYIQVNADQNVSEYNLNNFALRARPVADTQLCTSMTRATCPQLYALDWLSIYRPTFGSSLSGQASEFFLADVSDQYAGKTLEVTLFDPGEGMNNMQLLDPSGTPSTFRYRYANCTVGKLCSNTTAWPETTLQSADSCSGTPCLVVTNSKFNDQFVVIDLVLPANYTCGTNCWWKVRYTPTANATVTDRTTWSAKVLGGPVHLIE